MHRWQCLRKGVRVGFARNFCAKSEPVGSKRDIVGIAVLSSICLGAAGLGTWQVQRYYWKVDLIESIKRSASDPPVVLESNVSQDALHNAAQSMLGRRVLWKGRFDHSRELFLGLRTAPVGFTDGPAQGMATNPQGYYVITPLVQDDGTVVHVIRGWVTRRQYQQRLVSGAGDPWNRPQGRVEVEAVITQGEKPGSFTSKEHASASTLLWLDPAALARGTGLTDTVEGRAVGGVVIAEALGSNTVGAGEGKKGEGKDAREITFPFAKGLEQLQEQTVAPSTHFVYALTWFSLAAAGLFMTYIKFRRGGPAPGLGRSAGSGAAVTNKPGQGPAGGVGEEPGAFWNPVKDKGSP